MIPKDAPPESYPDNDVVTLNQLGSEIEELSDCVPVLLSVMAPGGSLLSASGSN
jgi:hypothetical protein